MAVRLGRGDDPLAYRMAAVTVARRALEQAADVASFTSRRRVPAGQREAGGRMIEAAPRLCRGGSRVCRRQGQHKGKQPRNNSSCFLHDIAP